MNLDFQYKEDIFVIRNFLSYDMYKSLHKFILKKDINESADKLWDPDMIGNHKPIFRKELDPDTIGGYSTLLRTQRFMNLMDKKLDFIAHKMCFGSGIQWHSDFKYIAAATLYINKNWNENWGGELMWKSESSGGVIPVISNTLVLMKTPMLHKVNTILSKNIARYSIQSFIRSK